MASHTGSVGFAGLESLITDISQDLAAASANSARPAAPPEKRPVSATESVAPNQAPQGISSPLPEAPSSNAGIFWVSGMLLLVFFLFVSSIKKDESDPKTQETTVAAKPPIVANPSLPFLPLPETDPNLLGAIRGMTEAAFLDDQVRLDLARQALDSMVIKPAPGSKESAKAARQKNAEGLKLMSAGDMNGAATLFHEAYMLNRIDVEVINNLGYALYKADEHNDAIRAVSEALWMGPRRANAWATLAGAAAATGKESNAIGALLLAFEYSKAPRKTREGFFKLAMETENPAIKAAVQKGMNRVVVKLIDEPLRSALSKLPTDFPMYFPQKLLATNDVGVSEQVFFVDNAVLPMTSDSNGYRIKFGKEADCSARACFVGSIVAARGEKMDTVGGEDVTLYGGVKGYYLEQNDKTPPMVIFHVSGVNYIIAMSNQDGKTANVDMANQALKQGPLYLFKTAADTAPSGTFDPSTARPLEVQAPAPVSNAMPPSSGYQSDAAILNNNGLSTFTVDNTGNSEPALAKLFRLGSRQASRIFFVKGGESFTAENLDSGSYVFRYKTYPAGEIYETDPFTLNEIDEGTSTRYSRMRVTLYKVSGGNLKMKKASPENF